MINMETYIDSRNIKDSDKRKKVTEVPIWEKYSLTVDEAAEYFNIGQNRLWDMIHENESADYILYKGRNVLIKRKKFEELLDTVNVV